MRCQKENSLRGSSRFRLRVRLLRSFIGGSRGTGIILAVASTVSCDSLIWITRGSRSRLSRASRARQLTQPFIDPTRLFVVEDFTFLLHSTRRFTAAHMNHPLDETDPRGGLHESAERVHENPVADVSGAMEHLRFESNALSALLGEKSNCAGERMSL